MQFSTALFSSLLLLLLLLAASEARKKPKQQEEKSPNSGKLRTRKGHQCTWETQERENNFLLSLSCSAPSEEAGLLDTPASYQCQFSGKPSECAAFRDKPEQYWKEVLTKLKKREKVCDGGKALKVRMCRKAPGSAHLKPVSEKKKKKKQKEVMMGDEGVRGEYCGEVWHPVCRFFQRFLSGEVQ